MARVEETRMHELFWQQTSYSACTYKIKRWKITIRCIEVTMVLQAFKLQILHVTVTTVFHDLAPAYLKGKIRQYWSRLYSQYVDRISVRNRINWASIYFSDQISSCMRLRVISSTQAATAVPDPTRSALRNTTLPLSLVSQRGLYTAPYHSTDSLSWGSWFYFSKFLHPCSTLLICVRHKSESLNYYVYSSSFSSR